MNKKKITAIYETTQDKVSKTLKAAGLDHNAPDFSRKDMELFDEAWTLIENGMSNTEATKEMKRRAEKDSTPGSKAIAIDSSLRAEMDKFLDGIADKFVGEAPEFIEEQKELARQYMIQRFWGRLGELAKSGELQKSFDRVLGSKDSDILEAAVLPGESPALPENSSSAT